MERRAFLTAVGLSVTASVAGCLGQIPGVETERIQLARFSVSNMDTAPHQFDLRVERNGETVHESTHDVDGRTPDRITGASAGCTWGTTPGAYDVFVRVDNGEWVSESLSEVKENWWDDVSCASVRAYYETEVGFVLFDNCEDHSPTDPDVCLPTDRSNTA